MSKRDIYAAALTPMNTDLSCNYTAFAEHCNHLIKQGCAGVVLFGTTGEGTSFTAQERVVAISELSQRGLDPANTIVGVSSTAIDDAVNLIRGSLDQDCTTMLVLPPFFYKKVDDEGLISYYREIINRVDDSRLRIILYHIPQYSSTPITLPVIENLIAEFPNTVVGIKESEGNLAFTKEILAKFPSFKVYVGKEQHIPNGVELGIAGAISGIANAYPELICALYRDQDPKLMEVLEHVVSTLKDYSFVAAMKAMIEINKGSLWNNLRPPLSSLHPEQKKKLLEALKG